MKNLLILFSLIFSLNISAQQDYQWLKIKRFKVGTLTDELKETSGLNFFKGKLYTFNDSGNSSELFEIDKSSGKILNKITTGLKNFDWEALASDENHFYIGEFGNNWGTRTDLKVYKIAADDSLQTAISFRYPEQAEFIKKPQNNNWDAESMIFRNGNLHVFTKEWESYKTTHYRINPADSSEIKNAEKLETFNLGYVATDAAYFDKKLYIVGYTKKLEVYLTVFSEDGQGMFFNQKPKKYYLGQTSKLGQIEGIAVNDEGIYISGEEFKFKIFNAKPALYFIPKDKLR